MINFNKSCRSEARLPYETPTVSSEKLTLITMGGTPGTGDSGDPTGLALAQSGFDKFEQGIDRPPEF